MKTRYYAAFVPDDGKISVVFPEFPGIITWGQDEREAADMAEEALDLHLTGMMEDGEAIPEPCNLEEARARLAVHCAETGIDDTGAFFQLVTAPDLDATPVRVNVSFRRATLASIDQKAAAAGMTRSGFLAAAAASYGAGG